VSERQLDGRLAWNIEEFARWWTSAAQEEKFRVLKAACEGRLARPTLSEIRVAIILAETAAGQVAEG
jgi:hypothetical protein